MQTQRFDNLNQIQELFPHADLVKAKDEVVVVVFNIGGNNYRLVATVEYQWQCVYIKRVMTHAEYDHWNQEGRSL